MNEKLKELRKKAMALPLSPGVYIMKNKNRDIIYIGKAKALKIIPLYRSLSGTQTQMSE
ncbi:MAG: hypothetical protein IIX27_02525 [Ruminococcus sp.]|nr:hypothetical protein [Ruminococcus sp.]